VIFVLPNTFNTYRWIGVGKQFIKPMHSFELSDKMWKWGLCSQWRRSWSDNWLGYWGRFRRYHDWDTAGKKNNTRRDLMLERVKVRAVNVWYTKSNQVLIVNPTEPYQYTISIITSQLHCFQLRTTLRKDFKFFSHGLCTEKQNILQHMHEK
jgi:hypothetical protein